MRVDWKLIATLVFSTGIFFLLSLLFMPHCSDCIRPHGWPFPYYRDGGFGDGACWIWGGMLGDALFVLTSATLLWAAWNAAIGRSGQMDRSLRRRSWGWLRLAYGLILFLDVLGAIVRQMNGNVEARFAPANSGELLGMAIAYLALSSIALWLIVTGVRRALARPSDRGDDAAVPA